MENEILKVISRYSIYSYEDIKKGYSILKSYDILVYIVKDLPRRNIQKNLIEMCKIAAED